MATLWAYNVLRMIGDRPPRLVSMQLAISMLPLDSMLLTVARLLGTERSWFDLGILSYTELTIARRIPHRGAAVRCAAGQRRRRRCRGQPMRHFCLLRVGCVGTHRALATTLTREARVCGGGTQICR